MRIALIAHDQKKDEMVEFTKKYYDQLSRYEIVATGTTGRRIREETGLPVMTVL